MYRAILDSVVMDEPQGWESMSYTLKRDYNIRGIVTTQDGQFVFQKDGYDYLYSLLLSSAGTSKVDFIIQISEDGGDTYVDDYKGIIFVSDCEFNERTKEVKCKIQDDSYYARINNNKSIGFYLYGSKSKNNISIDPCDVYTIQYFDVTTGSYITQTFNGGYEGAGYRSFDVLRFAIEWMTDGIMGFASSVFDTSGSYEHYYTTHGRAIQLADQSVTGSTACSQAVWETNWDKVSWETILKEYSNRFNLWWTIDYSTGTPVFRLEKEEYFRGTSTVHYAFDLNEIKTKINNLLFYAKVQFGQGEDLYDSGTHFPSLAFLGSRNEEFQVAYESNIDTTLNLKTGWTHSPNVIEYLLVNGTASDQHYDKMIFIIECEPDSGSNVKAVKANNIDNSAYSFYNQSLMNIEIAKRFFGAIPSTIASYLTDIDCTFSARGSRLENLISPTDTYTSIPSGTSRKIVFGTQIDDPGSNYDPSNSWFVVPRDGTFSFKVEAYWAKFVPPGTYIELQRYDAGYTTLLGSIRIGDLRNGAHQNFPLVNESYSGTISALAGELIIAAIHCDSTAVGSASIFFADYQYFYCIGSSTTGGDYQFYDPDDFPAFLHETVQDMSNSEFKNINQNNTGLCEFKMYEDQIRKGWFDMVKFTPAKSQASITLSSTKRIN